MSVRPLRIGEAARLAGVSPDTLRYYERMGVLPAIGRTESGYREYSDATVQHIRFVRNALRFGFSLNQVTIFLRARESGHAPCREVRAAAQDILARVERQIEDLKAARRAIRDTLIEWDKRLSQTSKEKPAYLLQGLTPNSIKTDCVSVRLKNGRYESPEQKRKNGSTHTQR